MQAEVSVLGLRYIQQDAGPRAHVRHIIFFKYRNAYCARTRSGADAISCRTAAPLPSIRWQMWSRSSTRADSRTRSARTRFTRDYGNYDDDDNNPLSCIIYIYMYSLYTILYYNAFCIPLHLYIP